MSDLGGQRREYDLGTLSRATLPKEPLELFDRWLKQALEAELTDATAMALATATPNGRPSVRIVLLKAHGPDGFVWYTDYVSRKAADLAVNPQAELCFYWREFNHQVRVHGRVETVDAATGRAYFETRPEDSRFSAAASRQSEPVGSRVELEARVAALRTRYPDGRVPMPEHWGGYRLVPDEFEFWQGREGRLHDRFLYTRTGGGWLIERLQP